MTHEHGFNQANSRARSGGKEGRKRHGRIEGGEAGKCQMVRLRHSVSDGRSQEHGSRGGEENKH